MKPRILAAALLTIALLFAPFIPGITAQDQPPRIASQNPAVPSDSPAQVAEAVTAQKLATQRVEIHDPIDYTIEILSAGAGVTTTATLTDVLPAGTWFTSGSLECNPGTCSYDDTTRTVSWTGEVALASVQGGRATPGELLTRASARTDPDLLAREAQGMEVLPALILPASAPPGEVIETFTNTWDVMPTGLVYTPGDDAVRYTDQVSQTADVWDIGYPAPHTVLGSLLLSSINTGWPQSLNERNGVGYDPDAGTYFLPDYAGDQSHRDDNIVEIDGAGTILNAWETDGSSNDSYDGSSIDNIKDIAVVPGSPNRYFATALLDGSVVYEIELTRTGGRWQPASWGTIRTCTVPGLADNAGIDYDATHGLLYHSDQESANIVVTDLACNEVRAFSCESPAGWNTGVTYVEGKSEPEIWVTDWESDTTTRCSSSLLPTCDQAPLFVDDLEAGLANWTATGLWHAEKETDTCGALVAPFPSPDTAAYFGDEASCSYDSGAAVTGTLEMNLDVDLTGATDASLSFWSYEETECGGFCTEDLRAVDVSTDGGNTWATVWTSTGPEGEWYQATASLWRYVGGPLRIRFRFDGDAAANDYFGWMVDSVEIAACRPTTVSFTARAPAECGDVVNEAVIASTAASSLTVTATTSVVGRIYDAWNFEMDDGGFVAGPASDWQWGIPDNPLGPSAHSGNKVWATNLTGEADDTVGDHWLTRTLTLPDHPESLWLEWWDWFDTDADDCARLWIDGTQVYEQCTNQHEWTAHQIDVSAWASQTVEIAFDLQVCCNPPGPMGWYVDDVTVYAECTPDLMGSFHYVPIVFKEYITP